MSPRLHPRTQATLVAVGIAIAGAIAYAPALSAGFVFDDHPLIEHGRMLRGPLWRLWLTADTPDYLPLTWSSLWVEWRLWGPDAAGYHATNLALHLLVALLLWRVLRALRVPGAAFAAFLFVVHPVTVESAAWISERKNTLSAVLFLASALAWLAFEERGRRRDWLLALVAFAGALLAKASTVFLPVALLAAAWIRHGRPRAAELRRLAPFFALSLAAGAVTFAFQYGVAMTERWLPPRGVGERVGDAAWALLSYVAQAFAPFWTAVVYPPWPVSPSSAAFYLPLALVAVAAGLLWRLRRGPLRPLALALGYHALAVAPILGIVDLAYLRIAPVSNHLQYLALFGPAALGGWALDRLGRRSHIVAGAVAGAVVMAFTVVTFRRAAAFESDLSLWQAAIRERPAAGFARRQLAVELLKAGRVPEAQRELAEVARSAHDPAMRAQARSYLLFSLGRADEASDAMREAAALSPDPAYSRDLGILLARAGRADEAIAVLRPLRDDVTADADVFYWLGAAYVRAGQLREAEAVLRDALDRGHERPDLHEALAAVLARSGRLDEARSELRVALEPGATAEDVERALRQLLPR